MGIDVYLKWDGQTEAEERGQITGFSAIAGRAGYLREAYHGGPYATHILAREAFESEDCAAEIPAATMRERLTSVTEPARGEHIQAGDAAAQMIMAILAHSLSGSKIVGAHAGRVPTEPQTVEECVRFRCSRIYPDMSPEDVEEYVQSFRDFVALAELKERETGKPCTVIASY